MDSLTIKAAWEFVVVLFSVERNKDSASWEDISWQGQISNSDLRNYPFKGDPIRLDQSLKDSVTQDIVENSRTTDYKVNGARALCDQEKRAKESPAIITVTLDCSHIQVYVLCGIKSEASHSVCVCVCVCLPLGAAADGLL